MASDNLGFISFNIKGIQQSSKRIKVFGYLRNTSFTKWLCFLQETQSSVEDVNQWSDNFKGQIFYSHGTTSHCGVTVVFLGSKSSEVVETKNDDQVILDI